MFLLYVLLVFTHGFVVNTGAEIDKFVKTLHGNPDPPAGSGKTFIFNADLPSDLSKGRLKRSPSSSPDDSKLNNKTTQDGIYTTVKELHDSHKQLMVHWVGKNSNVVICLARDPDPILADIQPSPSSVYISYDYGETYDNKTDLFKLPNGSHSTLEKFYNHPNFNTHFVFADIRHNYLFVTNNHGKSFKRIKLDFTPNDLSFHDFQPSTFVVFDKNQTIQRLWITEDFGETFQIQDEFVQSYVWFKNEEKEELLIQRREPNGFSVVTATHNLMETEKDAFRDNIKDFFYKGDYIFTTKMKNSKLALFVSYKLGNELECVFDTVDDSKSYMIVDVTGSRALVAVGHSDTKSNLYVSENLAGNYGIVKFTLSLPDVFCYFPNHTWHHTWLRVIADEAFADVTKVEGLSGIYIASRIVNQPSVSSLGPQHLGSVITFDHGATWRPIQPPAFDSEGQTTSCLVSSNCSLHLSQKFSQLYPDTRTSGILSSKSAPGVIMATGILGKHLKGHYGVFISLDAGLTWRQTLWDLHFFNMGNFGGILTAAKYFKLKTETRHILYSVDEGVTWNSTEFHNEKIRLYGLMTEPGENTTVFTMFGSLPEEHSWMIVKVDFAKAFKRQCVLDDYKMWTPNQNEEGRSYIPCMLGEQTVFQRREPNAFCLNDPKLIKMVSKRECDCDYLDFECDFAFMRTGLPPRCIRDKEVTLDPYKVPDHCQPGKFYNRTKGYRKISGDVCVKGFEKHYLPDLVPCPFNEIDDFLLFAQREKISRFNLVTRKIEEVPVKNLKNVIAIDFDMKNNCLYWADIAMDTIGRQCLGNGSSPEILVMSDLASIEGMAFDWISHTLYFVDGVRSKIELIRTDINHSGRMRRTVLDSRVLKKPRGIAVHPQAGYMFWTDWSSDNPSVNRANLDGSKNKTLFGREKVEWPNGITVDYIANRIYWVDARQDYIGSSDLHGDGFIKVVSNEDVVSHPFAIAVFKNSMYWDDWKRNGIFSADKDSFHGVEILLKELMGLMDLKVFAQGIQIGTNGCANSTCKYICVGLPKSGHACLCPDGMEQKDGKCLCPGGVEPLKNLTCPQVGNSCGPEYFTCKNGLCVPKGWRCDSEDDCGDLSDEAQCDQQFCPPSNFHCKDGLKCLPQNWKCDYDMDCADGSDEQDCPKQNCSAHQFACQNGKCISAKWKCDGENDCKDGSDEQNCHNERPKMCKMDEFRCQSGAVSCIPQSWKCDGEPDCRDGSDEFNCVNNTCSEGQFACGPPKNRCISMTWKCDGDVDCDNHADEAGCPDSATDMTPNFDEFNPKNGTCHSWMFKCTNMRCIPFWWKCDQANDCGDGSDELGCATANTTVPVVTTAVPPFVICENNQFQCSPNECIFLSWVCDGNKDCQNGADEENCEGAPKQCPDQFKCHIDGSCIRLFLVCNGIQDCPDGTDEAFCEHNVTIVPATPSCSVGLFPCDGGSCHPLASLCDGKIDCKNGFDESNCTNAARIYQVIQMGVDLRGINESSLLLYWWLPTPNDVKLDFLPAISKVSDGKWVNGSWTDSTEYTFSGLDPFTKYNMTVYVRGQDTQTIFPPAKYFLSTTSESVPSEPYNVTAKQRNGSHVLITWNKPIHPNGEITGYRIYFSSPESGEVKITLPDVETSHLLSLDFEHNVTYTFYVTATNKKYESRHSNVASLQFDAKVNVGVIKNLQIARKNDTSISLNWNYDGSEVEGFKVNIYPERSYPVITPRITKKTNITVTLAPGTFYQVEITAFKKSFIGPKATEGFRTRGQPLPEIPTIQGKLIREGIDKGISVKLSWERPVDSRKVAWRYGVYYGIDEEELRSRVRYVTTNQSATIKNLDACEIYTFTVGIIGPMGIGPLSGHSVDINTMTQSRAPPKKLTVLGETDNPLKMIVSWLPSCPDMSGANISYVVRIYEKNTHKLYNKLLRSTHTFYTFDVSCGGIYEVTIATSDPNAIQSAAVVYHAPPVLPPYEIKVFQETNGSYVIYWEERDLPHKGNISYEVLVQAGSKLDEAKAQVFRVNKPPFIYTNLSGGDTFTFAVRVRTTTGFRSVISEQLSHRSEPIQIVASTNWPAILIPSLMVVLALFGIIGFLIIRNRRLQSSFTRFTNSHYDTRAEAATFDDNGLEEEESPQIRGFSDDEPLVIA